MLIARTYKKKGKKEEDLEAMCFVEKRFLPSSLFKRGACSRKSLTDIPGGVTEIGPSLSFAPFCAHNTFYMLLLPSTKSITLLGPRRHRCTFYIARRDLFIIHFFSFSGADNNNMQSPRFVTQPSASASIVSEGRAKFLQCQAVGKALSLLYIFGRVNLARRH